MLSRQARAYIVCAYYSLYQSNSYSADHNTTPTMLTLPLIECLRRVFKTHRAAFVLKLERDVFIRITREVVSEQ